MFKEVESISLIGLDAIMFLRFVVFGFKFFGMITLSSIPLMILHFYSQQIDSAEFVMEEELYSNPTLSLLSLSNIPKGSWLFAAHVSLAYLYSFWGYYLLLNIWMEYHTLRKQYFEMTEYSNALYNRTLLFTCVPKSMCTAEEIQKHVKMKYPPKQIIFGVSSD